MNARPRSIRATDEQWSEIQSRAAALGLSATEYVLACSLHPDEAQAEVTRLRSALDALGAQLVDLTRQLARARGV